MTARLPVVFMEADAANDAELEAALMALRSSPLARIFGYDGAKKGVYARLWCACSLHLQDVTASKST